MSAIAKALNLLAFVHAARLQAAEVIDDGEVVYDDPRLIARDVAERALDDYDGKRGYYRAIDRNDVEQPGSRAVGYSTGWRRRRP